MANNRKKKRRKTLKRLPKCPSRCLFYDGPAFIFFNNSPEAAEHVIRVILNRDDLHVLSCVGQYAITKLDSHDVRCDVMAVDDQGTQYDIEIQQVDDENLLKRADYYGAMMKVDALKKRNGYKQNREVYVIFIIKDGRKWCLGKHVRSFYLCDDTKQDMHTGTRIYFVDGALIDDSNVGKLVQSFHCENANEMEDEVVAKRYREIKEILDLEDEMDEYSKKIYDMGVERGEKRGVQKGLARGIKKGEARGKRRGIKLGEKRGEERGEKRGEERGEKRGVQKGEAALIQGALKKNHSVAQVAELLGISEEKVRKCAEMKLD